MQKKTKLVANGTSLGQFFDPSQLFSVAKKNGGNAKTSQEESLLEECDDLNAIEFLR